MMQKCKDCGSDRIKRTQFGVQQIKVLMEYQGKEYPKTTYDFDGELFECCDCGNVGEKFEDVVK